MVVINHIAGIVKAFNDLKAMGFKSCAIIRTPDYSGGYRDCLQFSRNDDEDWWEDLEPLCYVEWNGTIADLYKEWPTMTMHREPFHEEPIDYEIDLFDEIESYIKWLNE